MSDIQLTFINRSNDMNNSNVVLWQEDVNESFQELALAWTVIQNCGRDCSHPFTYPMTMEVSANDSWGNFTPRLEAENGQLFEVKKNKTGDVLALAGEGSDPNEVQVANHLGIGAIGANIYKAGKLLAQKTGISPYQMAVFQFKPVLFIAAVSQIEEGDLINSAILLENNTELDLFGIQSADIVMRGGGPSKDSTPFTFTLENIKLAG